MVLVHPVSALVYNFKNNANVIEHWKLYRLTLSNLKYKTIKEQLKMLFSDPLNVTGLVKEEQNMKLFPVFNAKGVYYGAVFQYNSRFIGHNRHNTNCEDGGNRSSHKRKVNPGNK